MTTRPPKARTSRNVLVSVLVLALGLAAAASGAEQLLEIEHSVEVFQDGELVATTQDTGYLYLDSQRARFDQGESFTWILRLDTRRLFLVDHRQGTYQELRVPTRLEDYLSDAEAEKVRGAIPALVPRIETETTSETRTIGGWTARKTRLSGSPEASGTTFDYELWMSDEPKVDSALYREMLRYSGAVDFIHRDLASRMADLEGFPVLRESRVVYEHGEERHDVRRLVAVRDVDLGPDLYAPPADYLPIDFDLTRWIVFTED